MTDNLKRITQPPKAWHEGYDAGRRWVPRENPYSTESDDALAWVSGYKEGKTKPLRVRDAMMTILIWAAISALILLTRFGIPSIGVWRRRRRKAP